MSGPDLPFPSPPQTLCGVVYAAAQKSIPPNTELTISYGPEDALWFNPIYDPPPPDSTSAFIPHPPGTVPSPSLDPVDPFGGLLNIDDEVLDQQRDSGTLERKLSREANPDTGRRRRSRRKQWEQDAKGNLALATPVSEQDEDDEARLSRSTATSSAVSSKCASPHPPRPHDHLQDSQPVASGSTLPTVNAMSTSLHSSSSSSSTRSASSSSSSTSSFQIHPPSDPSVSLPSLPPPLCKPSRSSLLTHPVVLPPLMADPLTYMPRAEIEEMILWEDLSFKRIRAEGDESEVREREEVDDGWETFDIWAVDVEGAGKLTRDVLEFVMDTNHKGFKPADEQTKHLKRVRKSEAVPGQPESESRQFTCLVAPSRADFGLCTFIFKA